jgi:hypothetical protein
MDNLEKFIKQNKNAFDEEPSAELWNKISGQLQTEKQPAKIVRMMPIQRVWQIAAGFAALLVFGLALQWLYFAKQNEGLTAFKTPPPVEQLVPELAEAEKFYADKPNAGGFEKLRKTRPKPWCCPQQRGYDRTWQFGQSLCRTKKGVLHKWQSRGGD